MAHGPVVCWCKNFGETSNWSGRVWTHPVRTEELGEHIFWMDAEHPTVVHFTATLVGAPHTSLVWSERQHICRYGRNRGCCCCWTGVRLFCRFGSRRGCPRHLVFFGVMAVFYVGVARCWAWGWASLSGWCTRYRLWHYLFLGRTNDDDGSPFYERCPISWDLHSRPSPGRKRTENVQVQGKYHRSSYFDG